MTSSRATVPLAELCEAIVDCEHKTAPKVDVGYPSIRTTDIKNGRIDFESANRVSEQTYRAWTQRLEPEPGDLVLAREAPVGEVGIIPDGIRPCLGQRTVLLRPDRARVVPRYLLYTLVSRAIRHAMTSRAEGCTVPHLNVADIRELPVPSPPPLPEQERVATILGALDDKIELNRRMNRTLESIARAIFKSWFVDFDPVRKKMEGGEVGLPPDLAALFPDSLENSDLGEIPKGWEMGTLADFSTLNPGSWTKETRPTHINYVDLSNTKLGRVESVTTYARDDAPSRAQRVLRSGDTIVGTVRPGNGSYALVSDDGLTGSTGFAVLRPMITACAQYVYLAATAAGRLEALSRLADGGAYPAVRPEVVAATEIIRPSNEVLAAFSRVAGPLLGKLARNERQSRTLAVLRDALLPKLISGELRISHATWILPGVDA